jgi:hypothetical protein
MKKYILLLSPILFLFNFGYAQKWTYSSGWNVFDGKYKTSSIVGTGGEFPYTKPILVVNVFEDESLNVYVSDAGYAGCDNKIVYIKFDNSDILYHFSVTTNSNNDVWFLKETSYGNNNISIVELLEKMKIHNTLYLRLYSDCNQSDYKFSLSGSTTAINYVTSTFIVKYREQELIAEKIRKDEEAKKNEKIRIKELVLNGATFKTRTKNKARILYEPKNYMFYKDYILPKSEEIICSDYSNDKQFCVIKKATTINIPSDSIFYIDELNIDLDYIELIE